MNKRRVIFRVFPFNRLTFPTLLNAWEREGIDKHFEIIISEDPVHYRDDDVLVLSFMTPHLPEIDSEIKTIKKDVLIAAGGPHVTGDPELPEKLGIKILFRGEGEEIFIEFGRDLLSGNIPPGGKIYVPNRDKDPDKYMPFSKYFKIVPPLQIFNGCFWKCKYCQTGTGKKSFRTLDSIEAFLRRLKSEGFKRVTFISPSALEYGSSRPGKPDKEKIANLLELVSSFGFEFFEYGIFPSEIRPGTLDPELCRILKDHVTNNRITLGAQSGSDLRLRELNRGHSTKEVLTDVETANSFGFIANLDFIMGYPDETGDEREDTFNFIKTLSKKHKVRIHLHHFFPLSGSSYQFRLPTFLNNKDKVRLRELRQSGISTDWWEKHESAVRNYFSWLKMHFPEYLDKYK